MKLHAIILVSLFVALCNTAKAERVGHDLLNEIERNVDGDIQTKEREALGDILPFVASPVQALKDFDPIKLPFLPMITIFGWSLCLNNVTFGGFSDIQIPGLRDVEIQNQIVTLPIGVPYIYLHSDHYISGGMVLGLPIVGESKLQVDVREMLIDVTYNVEGKTILSCAIPGTTTFNVTVETLNVNFEDINPGKHSGLLINEVLSGLHTVVGGVLTRALNVTFHDALDSTITNGINTFLNERNNNTDCIVSAAKNFEIPRLFTIDETATLREVFDAVHEFEMDINNVLENSINFEEIEQLLA